MEPLYRLDRRQLLSLALKSQYLQEAVRLPLQVRGRGGGDRILVLGLYMGIVRGRKRWKSWRRRAILL
jgi:hypothetical protein